MHDYHPGLEGYDERQIWHDGCGECEKRGKDPVGHLYNLDMTNRYRAAQRAHDWRAGIDVGRVSKAEKGLLAFFIAAHEFVHEVEAAWS